MDEGKKSNERGRKESGRSGEDPDNKEGTVDDEEGTESTDINGREKEMEEKPVRKSENEQCDDREKSEDKEKKNDDVNEKTNSEAEKDNDGKKMKQKNKEGKEDEAERSVNKDVNGDCKDKTVKEVKEEEVFKDIIGNEKSREVLQVADGKAAEVQEVVDEDKVGLNKLSVECMPPEEGNMQLETVDRVTSINNKESMTYKEESHRNTVAGHEIEMASGSTICGQSSNQATSSKEITVSEQGKKTNEVPKSVEHPGDAAVDETQKQRVTDKSMRTDSRDHDKEKQKEDLKISENINKGLKKEEILTEVKKENPDKENEVLKKESKMEDDRIVTVLNKAVQHMADIEGSVNASLVSDEVCHTLQKEAKEREELSSIDVGEGEKGMIHVTQEKESKDEAQETSSSRETIKPSVQTETAAGKQEHQKTCEKEKTKGDSQAKKENYMKGLNDTEKGRREEYENREQQKELNADKRVLDLNYKGTSFVMKGTPESSAQKAADNVMEGSHEKQSCTSQETSVKSNEKHRTKSSKTLASTMTLPPKRSDERDQSQDILDMSITEKPIHTVFQGTITRDAKCEESIQRSDIMHSRQNQENNKIKAVNLLSTETAINDQLKQLEYKFQQSAPEKPAEPLKSQPLRQQTQNQQQEQNKMEKKQEHEQKAPAQQNQQKTQNRQQKGEIEQAQQKQIQQTQQPLKQKIQKNKKQYTQQNQQQLVIKEQLEIQKQTLVEQVKQRQPQLNEKSQQKQQEQKTKKQLQQPIKQENEEQQWQQEQKCQQQHMQSHKQENEREPKEQLKQVNQQQQQFQPVKQPQQETIQQKHSKWPQQGQHKQGQKPKEQQQEQPNRQEHKQMTEQQQEEKQKQQKQPNKGHHQQEQQPKQQSEEGEDDSAPGCGGTQGRSCPIYFGVKSYLHHFYDSAPVKDSQLYEDYTEEDDFEYTVDPIKKRGCRKCCRGFWFRAGLWGGINLILVGVITLLVGYLTPQREMIVGHHNNLEILDRTAFAFNRRLELCRLAGLAVFCCGGLVLLITLLLSTFLHIGGHNNNNGHCCSDNAYYGYVTTSLVEPFIAGHAQGSPVSAAAGVKIPITEQIKSVQPTLWPDIATVKDGALVPHMP